MELLRIEALSKTFGGLKALDDLSITIKEGSITSIIGPNGAGKSTLFNCITGFSRPTAGSVFFKDKEITGYAPHRVTEMGVARTFQNIRLFSELSVLDNVLIGTHLRHRYGLFNALLRDGTFRTKEASSVDEAMRQLEFMGLADYAEMAAGSLPYGLQRRLEIARAMATNPTLLLLDEPSAGMNPAETGELMAQLLRLNQHGLTLLIIEHDMNLVMGLSQHIVVINYGVKIAEGTVEEVRNNEAVIEAYLGKGATTH